MDKTEQSAVNFVSDLIGECPRLRDRFSSNDKTPVTDGFIDCYESSTQNNRTLRARVPVQIKGRTSSRTRKKRNDTINFPIEREVLRFFRDDGGGIYFCVSIKPDTGGRTAFYALLSPFKIDRLLTRMSPKQQKISVTLKKMPTDTGTIERIVGLAIHGRDQRVNAGFDSTVFDEAESLTIHSIDGFNVNRPTTLNLDSDDFAVTVHTTGGLSIPVDIDLDVYPASYMPHTVEGCVRCGEVEYESVVVKQTDDGVVEVQLSEQLRLTLQQKGTELSSNMNLVLGGNIRDQIKDMDFFLAARAGNELVMNGRSYAFETAPILDQDEMVRTREQFGKISALFDALDVDTGLIDVASLDGEQKSALLALYQGVVLKKEVAARPNGIGRFDLELGPFRLVLMVTKGSNDSHLKVFDPFQSKNRARFRLFQKTDEEEVQEILDGTVYEALSVTDLTSILNLRLGDIVGAYESLQNQEAVRTRANLKVLDLIKAADETTGSRRHPLLQGAANLNEWLISLADENPIHLINRWQILHRQGALTRNHRVAIQAARKDAFRNAGPNANLEEACYAILLGSEELIELALDALSDEELSQLRRWPIWSLSSFTLA